jgi:serine/threonine-protein kinase
MGGALEVRGLPAEGLTRYQQGLAIGERALPPNDPDLVRLHGNMVNVLVELGRPAEALLHSDRAIAISLKTVGSEHPLLALHFSNRGEILNELGRWEEGRAACARAMAIWERQLPKDHLFFSYSLHAIGVSYLGEGKPGLAVAPLERALRIRLGKEPSPGHVGETQFALARALWDSGESRARARALAVDAQTSYLKMAKMIKQQSEVATWLAKHAAPVAVAR